MATIHIKILGRIIPIACKDGEEEKVQHLAKSLNDTLTDLKIKVPNTQDINLLVIHSLMQMDKTNNNEDIGTSAQNTNENNDALLAVLKDTADTFESIAKSLENI